MRTAIIIASALVLAGSASIVSTNANAQVSSQHTITGGGQEPENNCNVCSVQYSTSLRNCQARSPDERTQCLREAADEGASCYRNCRK